ncbi:MAG: hypothetical protein ICV66_14220 [Chitinophagaceae bacterium]|nr:hypothetical protein [Chitinophagaceae bacterium]
MIAASCKKADLKTPAAAVRLSYGDSIIYLKNQSSDYTITPVTTKAGIYTAFPEGIIIDAHSGAINVSKSETGLRYRIDYTSPTGDTSSTIILLSGINYPDKYYNISKGDSIVFPIYNGTPLRSLPANGNVFDESNIATSAGCAINTSNGQINLAQTLRNGFFKNLPLGETRVDVDVKYRLNDQSDKALNGIRVRLYYYHTMNDVPQELKQTLLDRDGMFLRMNSSSAIEEASRYAKGARPRPPCVIVIAQ